MISDSLVTPRPPRAAPSTRAGIEPEKIQAQTLYDDVEVTRKADKAPPKRELRAPGLAIQHEKLLAAFSMTCICGSAAEAIYACGGYGRVQWKASRLRTVPYARKSLHKLACELGRLGHMTDVTAGQLDQVPAELPTQFHAYFIGWITTRFPSGH